MKHTKTKRKSLTFRIFINTFLLGALVYFVCAFLFITNLYSYFEKRIFTELENESEFLTYYAENSLFEELKKLKTENRITLIHKDGTVYFDNTVEPKTLENHKYREEFEAALANGKASVARYSNTMTERTLYFAKLLDSGDVLRISCRQHSVGVLILGMSETLLLMLVVAVIFSAISANLIAKKIVEPLNKINLDNPEENDVYEELKPFTRKIAEENLQKSERAKLREQFSANVSHELKTPLTSISGFAEILKKEKTDSKTTKDFASTIYDESQKMIRLINDIIKLSKLDENSISQQKESINLREMTKDIFETLSESAKKKHVSLNLFGDSGIILGVRSVIYEMIFNLVDNAIKYNKDNGKVDVLIETTSKKQVVLSVKDTGIGIPKTEQERVFERFYRVEKSRSKEKDLGGTGLGLSIVKHGAKYHNANVFLSSQEGKGSEFKIVFNI